jgi:hypothetical protein
MSIRRRFLVAAVPMVLAGAAGCSTYSYFDIDIRLDSSKWGSSAAANLISTCHMFVSGATSGDFDVNGDKAVCPPDPPSTDVGVIKYSTFADSGNVTFTLKAYQGAGQTDACETGEGTVTLPLALGHTSSGTLMIAPTGKTCQ